MNEVLANVVALLGGRQNRATKGRQPVMPACVAVDFATGRSAVIDYDTPAWLASMEWARFHGLDPMRIVAGSAVVRDAESCQIRYEEFVFDASGDLVWEPETVARCEQGEAPPLPWPPEVAALMS